MFGVTSTSRLTFSLEREREADGLRSFMANRQHVPRATTVALRRFNRWRNRTTGFSTLLPYCCWHDSSINISSLDGSPSSSSYRIWSSDVNSTTRIKGSDLDSVSLLLLLLLPLLDLLLEKRSSWTISDKSFIGL